MTSPTDIEAIRGRVMAWRPRRGTSEDFVRDDARSLLAALDAVTAENAILRACFCIEPDETVVSSTPGSILIDSKSGNRKRYAFASGDEQALMAMLDATRSAFIKAANFVGQKQRVDSEFDWGSPVLSNDITGPVAEMRNALVEVTAERDHWRSAAESLASRCGCLDPRDCGNTSGWQCEACSVMEGGAEC